MESRHEILRLHDDEHLSEREIALRLGLSPSTVHYWIVNRKTEDRRGRPRATDFVQDQQIVETSQQLPFLTASDLRTRLNPGCSITTVRRRLREGGQRCRRPALKPFLAPHHLQQRFAYASTYLHWPAEEWRRVVFSDEKIFRSSGRGRPIVYRPVGSDRYEEKYLSPSTNPSGRFTICVWMAFGGDGLRRLHRIEQKTLNSDYYTSRVLPSIEAELDGRVFQQDRSSIHTSKATWRWLREHNIATMDDWPPKGPDMNPVENVWAELVRRVGVSTEDVGNRDRLWEDVLQAFESLPQSYFEKLIESMVRRVRGVYEKRGGWTKY